MNNCHKKKENEFEQKMEETVGQLTKVKNSAILANEKFMKKNLECEDLKTKLQTAKERERALEKQNFCLKEEIKILKGTFAKASEDEVNASRRKLFHSNEPKDKNKEDMGARVQSDITRDSHEAGFPQFEEKYPLFRAEAYFKDLKPSEFDKISDMVIANGPFRASSLHIATRNGEIAKQNSSFSPGFMNPTDCTKDTVTVEGALHDERDTIKIDDPCSNHLKSAPAYLNTRPLPAVGPVNSYHISQAEKGKNLSQ
ncbi:uncharacterized protein [Montipora capricornis]|uniref:uncharacterized protein n=1 Tax=Montipora capricornis TaxID=246305 RepID=UPI0035F21030